MLIISGGCATPRNSVEGELLRDVCDSIGLWQLVCEPTRGENLLDLAFTDLDEVRCKVVSQIADHKGLALTLPLSVPRLEIQSRMVWQFREADWNGLRVALLLEDWTWLTHTDANTGAERLTAYILDLAGRFIPRRCLHERKSTHPWINDKVLQLVREKMLPKVLQQLKNVENAAVLASWKNMGSTSSKKSVLFKTCQKVRRHGGVDPDA